MLSACVCACAERTSQTVGACHLTAMASAGAAQAGVLPSDAQQLPASLVSTCAENALAQIPVAGTDSRQTGMMSGEALLCSAVERHLSY